MSLGAYPPNVKAADLFYWGIIMIGSKSKTVLFSFFTILLFSGQGLLGNENIDSLSLTYRFEHTPVMTRVNLGDATYDRVEVPDLIRFGHPGEPDLPTASARILLPMGMKVRDLQVVTGSEVLVGTGYLIEPAQEPAPLSVAGHKPTLPKEEVYSQNRMFPGLFTDLGTQYFRGYAIRVLRLNPLQYNPVTGMLVYFKEMTVSMNLTEDAINPLFRGLAVDQAEAMKRVDNPDTAETYALFSPSTTVVKKMLILTNTDLKKDWDEYAAAQPYDTYVIATSQTDPAQIRNSIKLHYVMNQITHVLIGADDNRIPARDFVYGLYNYTYMPTDNYYSNLDGTFDANGNGLYGEYPVDDLDFYAEVYIGRGCVDNSTEFNRFRRNHIRYREKSSSDIFFKKVLLVGEKLDDYFPTWGGDYMDQLVGICIHNGYGTNGIPTNYNIFRLYDRDWAGNDWPKQALINVINGHGRSMIHHLGHSTVDENMKLTHSDLGSLQNGNGHMRPFVYSQGCCAGAFDFECIAETWVVKVHGAAFAGIWNSRQGWYDPGGTDGPSQRFHRRFVHEVFTVENWAMGEANQASKEHWVSLMSSDYHRYCYFALTLFGDPAFELKEYGSGITPGN